MPIIDLYRELRTLEPRLLELPGLVQSGEVDHVLQVVGGNERLESVRRFIAQLRARMELRQDVPRALKLSFQETNRRSASNRFALRTWDILVVSRSLSQ